MAKHILKREPGASPSIVRATWRESPKQEALGHAGTRAVLDGSRVPKRMVEVGGVEPPSEIASNKLLRA